MAPRRARFILLVGVTFLFCLAYFSVRRADSALYRAPPTPKSTKNINRLKVSRWSKQPTQYPVQKLSSLPARKSSAKKIPAVQASPPPETSVTRELRLQRLRVVKGSFLHSWNGYKESAWLHDEVRPVSGNYRDPFGGWAATLVDTLDTLWIMDLKDEFADAVSACEEIDFATTNLQQINVFETTIRYLGGFLAAYELSDKQYPSLLRKATEVADLLMCAFDTPNRMPVSRWDWRFYTAGGAQKAPGNTLVAEIGSLSLELSKMSQLTGDMQYHDAAQRISDEFERSQETTNLPGMWPIWIKPAKWPMDFSGDSFTLGGMADSLYEYFPKQFLLLGGASQQPRKLYEGFIDVAKKHLLRRAMNRDDHPLMFFGDVRTSQDRVHFTPRAQHLTCFAGGMVGIAAKIFDRPQDLDIAAQVADGCYWSYNVTESGVGPEIFHFVPCELDPKADDCRWSEERYRQAVWRQWHPGRKEETPDEAQVDAIIAKNRLPPGLTAVPDRRYLLRPEAIESIFVLYRLTGDPIWQDKAWRMFTAIEHRTRTDVAAAGLADILEPDAATASLLDSMESFWLAETLKYFYLIFSDFDLISLDQWVLNTEAHPLRRADADI